MSYPRDLDEIKTDELLQELNRRQTNESDGRCTYCERPRVRCRAKPCRFPQRDEGRKVWSNP